MSWPALNWAKSTKVGSSTEKAVLLALAYRHNEDTGKCYPSIASIVEFTELNRKTVITALGKLEVKGLIADVGKAGRTNSIIVYRLSLDAEMEQSQKRDSLQNQEAVPILRGSSPNFTRKQSQNRDSEREGNLKEDSKESGGLENEDVDFELPLGLPALPPKDPTPAEVASYIEKEWGARADFATPLRHGRLSAEAAEKARDLGRDAAMAGETAIDVWCDLFGKIDGSDWLQGKVESRDRAPFKLSMPYLLKKSSFNQVLGGRFDGKKSTSPKVGSTTTAVADVVAGIYDAAERRARGCDQGYPDRSGQARLPGGSGAASR